MSFVSELIPSKAWVETYFVKPPEEGAERIGRAWHGHYPQQFKPDLNPIYWYDRGILFVSGLALCIPLVNTIVWIFMQTFLGEKPSRRDESSSPPRDLNIPLAPPSSRAFRSSGIVFHLPSERSPRSDPSSESER